MDRVTLASSSVQHKTAGIQIYKGHAEHTVITAQYGLLSLV
jgi:hypothetical protein